MNQHSPGFWTTERRNGCIAIVDANGHDVTYQDDAPRFHDGEPCGSVTSRGRTSEELEANARLIAAAPALLAACEFAEAFHEYASKASVTEKEEEAFRAKWGVPENVWTAHWVRDVRRAAIAKATH